MIRVVRLIRWPGRLDRFVSIAGCLGVTRGPFVTIAGGGRWVVAASGLRAYRLAGMAGLGLTAVGYGRWRRCPTGSRAGSLIGDRLDGAKTRFGEHLGQGGAAWPARPIRTQRESSMSRSLISRIRPRRRITVLASACVALAAAGALLLVGTASAAPSAAAGTTPSCSNATLNGTYTFGYISWSISNGQSTPASEAGFDTFNGRGTGVGVITAAYNGVLAGSNTPEGFTRAAARLHIRPEVSGGSRGGQRS
jgi:hypothetical protein